LDVVRGGEAEKNQKSRAGFMGGGEREEEGVSLS